MSVKTIIEGAVVQSGTKKDGGTYYFVEVNEPVRKYINPDKAQDNATLQALADSGEVISQLTLHQRYRSLIFSSLDLT